MPGKRGEVVLVPFPFTDLSTTKVRPALVVSSVEYMRHEPDLILLAITSKLPSVDGKFDVRLAGWAAAGLKLPSAIKPILFTLHPTRVLHRLGNLTKHDLAVVDVMMRQMLGL